MVELGGAALVPVSQMSGNELGLIISQAGPVGMVGEEGGPLIVGLVRGLRQTMTDYTFGSKDPLTSGVGLTRRTVATAWRHEHQADRRNHPHTNSSGCH